MPESLIDESYLSEVEAECDHDRELLREYVDLLAEMVESERGMMEQGQGANDVAMIRAAAHRLKGGAANVACTAVAALCAEIEQNPACFAEHSESLRRLTAQSIELLGRRWAPE